MMKKLQNKELYSKIRSFIIIALLFIFSPSVFYGHSVEINNYKLEIKENSGRFELSKKTESSDYVSVFSEGDLRTSSFSIYENNGFYTLGDTFRYRKYFSEKVDGGTFTWTSKELLIEQEFTLGFDGYLRIDISISNISTAPKTSGLKFLLDTGFEDEDYFYLKTAEDNRQIESEFEVENPEDVNFWTSGVRNSKGAALMGIPSASLPSRIIFGNWDLLDDADYYYKTAAGRNFNNPPYSINDCAVLYLFSPKDILPQNSLKYSIKLRVIPSVENFDQIDFEETRPEMVSDTEKINTDQNTIETSAESVPQADEIKESELLSDAELAVENENPETAVDETDLPENTNAYQQEPDSADVSPESESDNAESSVDEDVDEDVDESADKSSELLIDQIKTAVEIEKLIETLSKPGIINEYNLSQLEELIKKLEEIGINEN